MKKGDIFGNDSDNESEENESDNESEKSEKSEENDGDDEDKESKNGSDDEDDKESNNESDKESNNDDDDAKDNKWEEYDSIEPHNDESIWTKIREQAVQDLEDKFEEVDKNIQAQGFSVKEAKFRAYRETLKPLRKRVYKIYTNMVDDLDRLDRDPVHKQIKETGKRLKRKYHSDYEETMKMAIKKRKYLIHKAALLDSDLEESDFSDTEDE